MVREVNERERETNIYIHKHVDLHKNKRDEEIVLLYTKKNKIKKKEEKKREYFFNLVRNFLMDNF